MGLLIESSVQLVLSQKTVHLGHGIAHRVKRTIFLEARKRYTLPPAPLSTGSGGSSPRELNISKSLGFGWPQYSSIESRVFDKLNLEGEESGGIRPSRAMAANLGDVPAGFRGVWSR